MKTDANPDSKKLEDRNKQYRIIDSKELFGGHRQILINHDKQTYQLQITRQNKLILTK